MITLTKTFSFIESRQQKKSFKIPKEYSEAVYRINNKFAVYRINNNFLNFKHSRSITVFFCHINYVTFYSDLILFPTMYRIFLYYKKILLFSPSI